LVESFELVFWQVLQIKATLKLRAKSSYLVEAIHPVYWQVLQIKATLKVRA